MGTYINPGNSGFAEINGDGYVDKTMLIEKINGTICKSNKLTCISRPRRFGKSYAARMLSAYYDSSCDSHSLFDDKLISRTEDYEKHLNKYNVIYLEVTSFISRAEREGVPLKEIPNMIVEALSDELDRFGMALDSDLELKEKMLAAIEISGKKFIFIIDEWDAVIREAKNDIDAQKAYLNLLREWFKNGTFTPKAVAAAYMTGILPIKKDGSQSAISDFNEYTMVKPLGYAEFVGFTENEVKSLCSSHGVDFEKMKLWYDGYEFKGTGPVYNPNSVMKAIQNDDFDSYWSQTSAAEGLLDYISREYNGLTKTIAELVGGVDVKVNTTGFANDLTTFRGKDDVLTLLIHLGYLSYDSNKSAARIPNEEIRREFQRSIHEVKNEATMKRINESETLFSATVHMDEKKVAELIEKVHMEETVAIHYNSEESLRSVIKLAYYTYRDHYLQFEELPAGEGYADVVYIPLPDSDWPALVVELKWNKSSEGAIEQILQRKYPSVLENIGQSILLVGISYDRDNAKGRRKHTCRIIEYKM